MNAADAAELLERFTAQLGAAERTAIGAALCWAADVEASLYLVGGTTRDLLLGRPPLDIDIAVDGDALALGALVAERFGAALTTHRDFATAIVESSGWRIDLARTRTEQYASSGALPAVQPAAIAADLGRRDFAANAIALRIAPLPAELIDPYGGIADVRAGLLRTLHPYSFVDDPTRILRLTRYAARLSWQIEAATDKQANAAAPLLANVSAARVWHEFERTLEEPRPEDAVALLARYPAAPRALGLDRRRFEALASAYEALRAEITRVSAAHYLAAAAASGASTREAADLLALPDEGARAIEDAYATIAALERAARAPAIDIAALSASLDRLQLAAVEGALAALRAAVVPGWSQREAGFAADWLDRYRHEWRNVRARLDGNDVQALGVARGPAVGRALQSLRAARLLGETQNDDDERELVQRLLREGRL